MINPAKRNENAPPENDIKNPFLQASAKKDERKTRLVFSLSFPKPPTPTCSRNERGTDSSPLAGSGRRRRRKENPVIAPLTEEEEVEMGEESKTKGREAKNESNGGR